MIAGTDGNVTTSMAARVAASPCRVVQATTRWWWSTRTSPSVEGGYGTDTLLWGGGDASTDRGQTLAGRVHDIEVIDLNDTSSVALTLNLADVVAITETGTDTLIIKGD